MSWNTPFHSRLLVKGAGIKIIHGPGPFHPSPHSGGPLPSVQLSSGPEHGCRVPASSAQRDKVQGKRREPPLPHASSGKVTCARNHATGFLRYCRPKLVTGLFPSPPLSRKTGPLLLAHPGILLLTGEHLQPLEDGHLQETQALAQRTIKNHPALKADRASVRGD